MDILLSIELAPFLEEKEVTVEVGGRSEQWSAITVVTTGVAAGQPLILVSGGLITVVRVVRVVCVF